jgi:sensor histidine kinase YesM
MKKLLAYFISTFLFNTAIAAVLNLFMEPFWHQFVYSQCIGFSILIINMVVAHLVKHPLRRAAVLSVSLPGSAAVGVSLAFILTGTGSWSGDYIQKTMAISLFFGLIGVITFLLSERIDMEVKQRQLAQSESERREVEANLKLLQAQIEPHFLFNTLANVSSLIDSDPTLAKKLLERLNDWLRVALVRARSDKATLGDELDMLENYLQILRIRFGERLRWTIDAPNAVREMAFPPMLLQPLVENAVRHGIEPKIGGGQIVIAAHIEDDKLYCEVSDDGIGIQDDIGGGAGLANVRERLAALYGGRGHLSLSNGAHGGTVVRLELPL